MPINAWAEANYHRASKPIVDKQGRTRVIVDFTTDALLAYPRDLLIGFDPKKDVQQPQALALIKEYERLYGFTREGLTTWVGASVTAFLTTAQIELLKVDRNVRLLTEDEYVQFSSPAAPPPWYPSWTGAAWGELNDWGRTAVNGKTVLPDSNRKVYIIDSGVAYHADLGSVSQRVNVNCGTGADCSGVSVGTAGVGYYSTVGCYAHATHVAGIVGASADNGTPRVGVYAGVNMVSIALGASPSTYNSAWIPCAQGGTGNYNLNNATVSNIGFAFDFIAAQNQPSGPITNGPNIATMSINGGKLGVSGGGWETNRSKLMQMVTPSSTWHYVNAQWQLWTYPGIFFTQSAGNQNQDACLPGSDGASVAYQTYINWPRDTSVDGIMVVGAIRQDGTAVSDTNGPTNGPRFSEPEPRIFGTAPTEVGSNFGNCVDIWAPGDAIYSTWGSGLSSTYSIANYFGGQPSTYIAGTTPGSPTTPDPATLYQGLFGWQWLSGTSMAAPHVAAAAAYMADKYNLMTPTAIEQKIRDNWKHWSALDPLGNPVRILYLPD